LVIVGFFLLLLVGLKKVDGEKVSCPAAAPNIYTCPFVFLSKEEGRPVISSSPTYSPNVIKIQEERKNIYIVLQGRNLKIFTTHLYGALQLIPGHLFSWVGLGYISFEERARHFFLKS
jgi:hypothetical protein